MRELAQRLGVSAATISAVENGQTGISLDRLSQFAGIFRISAAALLEGADRVPTVATAQGGDWRVFTPLRLNPALSAAVAAFVATGYHGSSMRSIAERAGLSLAGIYHYYPSKQQLLTTILDLTMDDLEWRITAATAEASRPILGLHRAVEALALFHVMRADLAFVGASEMRSLEEPARTRVAQRRSSVQHLLDDQIARVLTSGHLDCPRPRETSRAIATMCTALPQWFDMDGATPAATVARGYADLAVRMIGAECERPSP